MEKLPATSYVRLVDIWLIFSQLYPFIQENFEELNNNLIPGLQVVLFTIIEMEIVEEYTNNHGFRRFVPESQKKEEVSISIQTWRIITKVICFQKSKKMVGNWLVQKMEIPSVNKIAKIFGKNEFEPSIFKSGRVVFFAVFPSIVVVFFIEFQQYIS